MPSSSSARVRVVVRLRGELTFDKAPRVRKRLGKALSRAPDVVEVDLGKVTYLAPDIAALLLTSAVTARRAGTGFSLSRAGDRALHTLWELGMQHLTDTPLNPGR
ncbi:STAS domain-containing protein [Streptomyces apricus]|uniref:STAS domain-containing protein n=1 Tax=Streptomyces apricus TaxID=1828112 RepID=UPI00165FE6E1|nr:STAS domain-containing protein [Streptomyces apricus]